MQYSMRGIPIIDTVRKILAALLCAVFGFLVCGSAGAIATALAYGVGGLFSAPCGAIAGAVIGWKTPLRDAVLPMAGWGIGWWLAGWLCDAFGVRDEKAGSFVILFWQLVTSSAGGIALFLGARKCLDMGQRFILAVGLTVFWIVCSAARFYQWLYMWEPH